MHNVDNSGTIGSTRRIMGFPRFLVVKTFNLQVYYMITVN